MLILRGYERSYGKFVVNLEGGTDEQISRILNYHRADEVEFHTPESVKTSREEKFKDWPYPHEIMVCLGNDYASVSYVERAIKKLGYEVRIDTVSRLA